MCLLNTRMKYSHYYHKTYNEYLNETGEAGNVRQVLHPIVYVDGLPLLRLDEVVFFETGEIGITMGLSENYAEVLVLSKSPISPNIQATRTGKLLSVPLRTELLGKTIDALGIPLDLSPITQEIEEYRSVHAKPLSIGLRKKINRPFFTGVSIVDLLIPLGHGQRELVIGDRKTGKSSFLLQCILSQVRQGTICIYAAIGQKSQDIQKIRAYLEQHGLLQNTILIATSPADAIGMIYLTPYTAMTIAEYFRDKGHDCLVILDDLTTHAKFYRELSLIARRFPGRSSYPGDMFFAHAQLLERAGNFGVGDGREYSITCLPVASTTEGNISGYIQTNLMSITDGHIFLDEKLFTMGRRPAVNHHLSVTRVGRQTQSLIRWGVNRELNTFLAWVDKTRAVAHFGAELNTGINSILEMAERIETFFNQHNDVVLPINVQILLFSLLWIGEWQGKDRATINVDLQKIATNYEKNLEYRQMVDTLIKESKDFNNLLGKVTPTKQAYLPT